MPDLTDYEWQFAERFRDDLFDLELGSDLSLIDPEHPLAGGITALLRQASPPRRKRPRTQRPQPAATQERLELD